MKSISIRNIPDDVYDQLQKLAKTNRRSLQEQVKLILEKEVRLNGTSFLATAGQWRTRLENRSFDDSVTVVRKDRER